MTAPSPLWNPLPGPQTAGHDSRADVLGYGGQAGGGKSDLLLGLASTKHLRSVIFRREAKQGRGMIDRARELFHGHGRFNENSGVWRGLPGNRQIEFAGVKDPADVLNWRGQPHDLIAIDEADAFLESQVLFLLGWNRTVVPGQRCRAVLCFNPPATAEGRWLIKYFGPWLDRRHPSPALPGELRWYARFKGGAEVECAGPAPLTQGGETVQPKSRTFIPASVRDNPYLMATGYEAQLQSLPEPLRSQLLYGDFAAGIDDDPWQVIPSAWVEDSMRRWQPGPPEGFTLTCLGVDVAAGGADKTVIASRFQSWIGPLLKYPGTTTPDGQATADRVLAVHDSRALVNVDALPASAYERLRDVIGQLAQGINNAAKAEGHDRSGRLAFTNVRAASWWKLREALDPAGPDRLDLPPDPELLADLTEPKYKVLASGIQIESKEEIKKRIGRSPDCGDAVVLSLWGPQKRRFTLWA